MVGAVLGEVLLCAPRLLAHENVAGRSSTDRRRMPMKSATPSYHHGDLAYALLDQVAEPVS